MRPNTEFSVFTSTTSGFDAVLMTRAGSSRGGSGLPKQARVEVVGDTCVSEQGMAAIVARDKRYHVCGGAHGFYDAVELIRKHQPDLPRILPPPVHSLIPPPHSRILPCPKTFRELRLANPGEHYRTPELAPENYENQYVQTDSAPKPENRTKFD